MNWKRTLAPTPVHSIPASDATLLPNPGTPPRNHTPGAIAHG
jgi:hypothetical protein